MPVITPTSHGFPESTLNYARNIWDLLAFGGKLYIGFGNSANDGPNPNAGPLPVAVYDPATNTSSSGVSLNTSQVDVLRVLASDLITPCHDPTGADNGIWYRLESGAWVTHTPASLNGLIVHWYDIAEDTNGDWLGCGHPSGISSCWRSTDAGATWAGTTLTWSGGSLFSQFPVNRWHRFFRIGSDLYCSTENVLRHPVTNAAYTDGNGDIVNATFCKYSGAGAWVVPDADPNAACRSMFSGHTFAAFNPDQLSAGVARTATLGSTLVYIGANVKVNDHQWVPFGLFKCATYPSGSQIALPGARLPWDVLVVGSTCYVLCGPSTVTDGSQDVYLYSSTDLSAWTEVGHFTAASYARSLEKIGTVYYFGLGEEVTGSGAGELLSWDEAGAPSATSLPPFPPRTPRTFTRLRLR